MLHKKHNSTKQASFRLFIEPVKSSLWQVFALFIVLFLLLFLQPAKASTEIGKVLYAIGDVKVKRETLEAVKKKVLNCLNQISLSLVSVPGLSY